MLGEQLYRGFNILVMKFVDHGNSKKFPTSPSVELIVKSNKARVTNDTNSKQQTQITTVKFSQRHSKLNQHL